MASVFNLTRASSNLTLKNKSISINIKWNYLFYWKNKKTVMWDIKINDILTNELILHFFCWTVYNISPTLHQTQQYMNIF